MYVVAKTENKFNLSVARIAAWSISQEFILSRSAWETGQSEMDTRIRLSMWYIGISFWEP